MGRREALVDAALLGVLGAAVASGAALTHLVAGPGPGLGYVWVAVAVQAATLPVILVRRHWPVPAGMAIATSAILQTLVVLAAPRDLAEVFLSMSAWAPIALSVAVENITERGIAPSRSARVWMLIGVLTVVSSRPWDPDTGFIVNGLLHSAVAPLVGLYLAARRRRMQVLRERAERAEREQWWRAEQARAEERGQLAAEIHDLVAHRVTLIVLQAGALQVSAPDEATRAAAGELRDNGARALDELRELVGVLRRPADPAEERSAATADERPPPALEQLLEDSARVGQPVRFTQDGDASAVSHVVGRTAYRVVQEALTNVRKHAFGTDVRLDVRYGADRIRIVVHNTRPEGTPPLATSGGGTGLAGLRERVELIGGSMRASPDAEGGFRVETVMPARVGP